MTTDTPAEVPPVPVSTSRRRRGVIGFLRDLVIVIVIALVVSFLIKTFVARSFFIPSASMEQTLRVDDRILVDELTPNWNPYTRGEVVVFADPGGWLSSTVTPEPEGVSGFFDAIFTFVGLSAGDSDEHLVKRIVGLPGDHVTCCNAYGQLTVNGTPVNESSYLNLPEGDERASNVDFDVTVPEGALWMMGDNRDRSQDSRFHTDQPGGGFVPIENVVGRVWLITWPFDHFGVVDSHPEVFAGVPDPAAAG